LPEVQGEFKRLIDIGCGKGIFSFELARRFPTAEVVAIDTDAQQIAINQTMARKHGHSNLRFEVQDVNALRVQDAFDFALCVDNLEHIENDQGALKRIFSILAPGGTLLCHVPAYERIWLFRKRATNFDVPGHVRPGYRLSELQDKLEAAGFIVSQIQHTYGYWETVSNNLSYLITGAEQKRVWLYALAFPFLNLLAWLGRRQEPGPQGAGLLAKAVRPKG